MGVGGELNGAVYQAASTLNQIPETTTTTTMACCSPDDDLCQLIYCFKLINATFVLFSLMIAFAICSFLSFFNITQPRASSAADIVLQQITPIYDSWLLPGH